MVDAACHITNRAVFLDTLGKVGSAVRRGSCNVMAGLESRAACFCELATTHDGIAVTACLSL